MCVCVCVCVCVFVCLCSFIVKAPSVCNDVLQSNDVTYLTGTDNVLVL